MVLDESHLKYALDISCWKGQVSSITTAVSSGVQMLSQPDLKVSWDLKAKLRGSQQFHADPATLLGVKTASFGVLHIANNPLGPGCNRNVLICLCFQENPQNEVSGSVTRLLGSFLHYHLFFSLIFGCHPPPMPLVIGTNPCWTLYWIYFFYFNLYVFYLLLLQEYCL